MQGTMTPLDGIFYVAILIMSVVIHEFAHGYAAYRLGDDTARLSGRLTLNPIKHLDLFGSFILPFLLIISNAGFVIGWARPVPYNPNNLKDFKKGTIIVSIAGILANLFVAIFFCLIIRFAPIFGMPAYSIFDPVPFYKIATSIALVNFVLAFFNLIPIPPLDGSKVLFAFLPAKLRYLENFLERWGMIVLLLFIVFLWGKFAPVVFYLFSFFSGV